MRLIVAEQEANESEPQVKLSGNHTAPKKAQRDIFNTKQMQRERQTGNETPERRAYATDLLQL